MRHLLIALIVSSFSICFGQEAKFISKGMKYFDNKKYSQAISSFKDAYDANPENPKTAYYLGKSYLEIREYKKALTYLSKGVKNLKTPTHDQYYDLAQAYHTNNRFDDAIIYYKKSDPYKKQIKRTNKRLLECNTGKKLIAKPVKCKITNMGGTVNTKYHDYLPKITADRMYMTFTSRRSGSTGSEKSGVLREDVYFTKNAGGVWATAKQFKTPINTIYDDACIGLSEDGQTMFLYKGTNGGDIYISELNGDKWSTPVAFQHNTEHFESSASLAPDGRTLYFVRSIGTNKDIWVSKRNAANKWSTPQKLGGGINTRFDEESPYMHADGKTLYFSSKGHSSMGGYDIFKTVKTGNVWSKPINIGYPINTSRDDIYFVLAADGKLGYYSTQKEGGRGLQDLYTIRMPISSHSPALTLLKGIVKDIKTKKPICSNITITNNATNKVIGTYKSNCKTGEFLVSLPSNINYGISVDHKGYLFFSDHVFLPSSKGYKKVTKSVNLTPLASGAKVVLQNIFFDVGKYELKPTSYAELNRVYGLLKKYPNLKIEISGHTDNIGNNDANVKLSKYRAFAVTTYLKQKGISANRLTAKGYGSSKPLASNESETGRAKNRRTEFKIISTQ